MGSPNTMNISWLANQLPACKQKSEVVDPHEWYKNLALATGWVIGVLVVINWAVEAREAWERFGGNAHRTEELLQEMASYPKERRTNIRNWNKVFPYTLGRSASSASSAASADERDRRHSVFGGSFNNKRANLHSGIKHYATDGSTGGNTHGLGIF